MTVRRRSRAPVDVHVGVAQLYDDEPDELVFRHRVVKTYDPAHPSIRSSYRQAQQPDRVRGFGDTHDLDDESGLIVRHELTPELSKKLDEVKDRLPRPGQARDVAVGAFVFGVVTGLTVATVIYLATRQE